MLPHTTILVWLLVTPLLGAALCLLGAWVIGRLPDFYRDEAAPAPHYAAAGICLFSFGLEALLFTMGSSVTGDFRWTTDFAQFRLHLDRTAALFLPVVTLAGLAAVVAQARRGSPSAAAAAHRQAPVLLAMTAGLLAVAAGDLFLLLYALGAAMLCGWWAAGVREEPGGQHVLAAQAIGLAVATVGVAVSYGASGEGYLPAAGLGMMMATRPVIRLTAMLVAVGLMGALSAAPGLTWTAFAMRGPGAACYLPAFAAAAALLVRVPWLLTPHLSLGKLGWLAVLPAALLWLQLLLAVTRRERPDCAHRLWSGLGAAAAALAVASWPGPTAGAGALAAGAAAAAAIAVAVVALGSRGPAPDVAQPAAAKAMPATPGWRAAALGVAIVAAGTVGWPLAVGAVTRLGWFMAVLLAPAPLLLAAGGLGLWRSRADRATAADWRATLVAAGGLAMALGLALLPPWLGVPHLPGVLP